jgi:hypothetical protein
LGHHWDSPHALAQGTPQLATPSASGMRCAGWVTPCGMALFAYPIEHYPTQRALEEAALTIHHDTHLVYAHYNKCFYRVAWVHPLTLNSLSPPPRRFIHFSFVVRSAHAARNSAHIPPHILCITSLTIFLQPQHKHHMCLLLSSCTAITTYTHHNGRAHLSLPFNNTMDTFASQSCCVF